MLFRSRIRRPVDLLKAPHHGSATSSSRALLDATEARASIVSVGAGNPYGHPNVETLERLAERGSWVGRTDRDGAVVVDVDLATGAMRIHDSSGEVRVPSRSSIVAGLAADARNANGRPLDATWPAIVVRGATDAVGRIAGGCPLRSARIGAWAHRYSSRGATISS